MIQRIEKLSESKSFVRTIHRLRPTERSLESSCLRVYHVSTRGRISKLMRDGVAKFQTEVDELMGNPAARLGDKVLQTAPHCHAPIHPAAPTPTPIPHPPMPLTIVKGVPTVMIGGKPAATATSTTSPCMLASCTPAGPGMIAKGSATVMIGMLPAARARDKTAHPSCVAPIPSPSGFVMGPGCLTVLIGG